MTSKCVKDGRNMKISHAVEPLADISLINNRHVIVVFCASKLLRPISASNQSQAPHEEEKKLREDRHRKLVLFTFLSLSESKIFGEINKTCLTITASKRKRFDKTRN